MHGPPVLCIDCSTADSGQKHRFEKNGGTTAHGLTVPRSTCATTARATQNSIYPATKEHAWTFAISHYRQRTCMEAWTNIVWPESNQHLPPTKATDFLFLLMTPTLSIRSPMYVHASDAYGDVCAIHPLEIAYICSKQFKHSTFLSQFPKAM